MNEITVQTVTDRFNEINARIPLKGVGLDLQQMRAIGLLATAYNFALDEHDAAETSFLRDQALRRADQHLTNIAAVLDGTNPPARFVMDPKKPRQVRSK